MLNIGARWDYEENPSYLDFKTPQFVLDALNTEISPGLTYGESLGLKIEWRLPRSYSLAVGSEPSTSALFCTSQNTAFRGFVATPRQYGFDLFKSWQF